MLQLNRENPIVSLKQKISVKVEETIKDEDHQEYFYKSEIDKFDELLYDENLRNQDIKKNYFVALELVPCIRFKFSQIFYTADYKCPVGVELFDNLSTAPPFRSRDLGIVTRPTYKKLLSKPKEAKIQKYQKTREFTIEEEYSSEKYQKEQKEIEVKSPSLENEEVSASFRLIKKKGFGSFKPTYAIKTTELNIVFSSLSTMNIQKLVLNFNKI